MPEAQSQSESVSATLVLQEAVRVQGDLSALAGGRLQLASIRVLEKPDASAPAPVTIGSSATLALDSLPEIGVRICELSNDRLNLEFIDSASDLARRYLAAIDGEDARAPAKSTAVAATAAYARLLDNLRQRSLKSLEETLAPFFSDLTGYMVELSALRELRGQREDPYYEAAVTIRSDGGKIAAKMLAQIEGYYDELTPDETEDQLWRRDLDSSEDLDLVDLGEFEDYLAIDRMVTQGEDLNNIALEALTVRLATLIDADPNDVRLPVHVRQICRAFQRALIDQGVPKGVLSPIFDYFAKRFIRQLADYYNPLNTYLAEHEIRPNVEIEIQHSGSFLERNRKKRSGPAREHMGSHYGTPSPASVSQAPSPAAEGGDYVAGNTTTSATGGGSTGAGGNAVAEPPPATSGEARVQQALGRQITDALGGLNPAKLYLSVVDALNFKREAEGLADGKDLDSGTHLSGTWDGATVASADVDQNSLADAQSIARALGALQRDSLARNEVQQSDSLRAYLAANKDKIHGLEQTSGLTADSLNQLDMVDNLFGTIRSQLDVSAELKPALGNLQIPLAKLALMDPRFFVDQTHTARAVIDKLSQLAASANFPNRALESRINAIVDEIIADYETDATVFETALEKVERLVAQQERALSRNIDRVVRTQEGQEKLAEAKRAVNRLIGSRLEGPRAPEALIDLIESGWRDLLVLTHVKEGPNSKEWSEQVRTLDMLCLWLEQRINGDLDEDLNVQRSLESEPLIELIGQQISTALPTNVSHEAVLARLQGLLTGSDEIKLTALPSRYLQKEPEPEELRARIEDLPRLRRWVKRVEQLEENTWLTYRDRNNEKKRMQLAWISPNRDRYIFVNERGQKTADFTAIQLARKLSRGVKPPAPSDQFSVVDRSMFHTLEHVQKTLSFARNHDSLTKLINRDTFLNQMERALRHAQQKRTEHAVLYLNIDRFKLVNDIYDRVVGDQVLLEFARLLSQLHGKKSSSARLDDDEFGILLLDRSAGQAMEVAEKVRADIEAGALDIDGESVSFTVSIGVTSIQEHSPSVEQLLEDARAAMQLAKQAGRNRVTQFEERQGEASAYKQEKAQSREDLEKALATERFVLRAQPIVQTAVGNETDSKLHYELLLGLTNKDGTLASPEEFIKSAERYGFMTLVDRWVVKEAFSWISQLMDAQKVVPDLSINLSGTSVTDDAFMEYLFEQISEFGVGTSRLCFEITETGTISNLVKAADFVRAFRNIGCKFSIDDFGTGLASHNYLRELPVDYVKIDGSFITGIHKNRNDYAMARSINDLAHFLGQKTIAESVENDQIVAKLRDIGVDYLQGWGIGRPKPLAEVTSDLSSLEK
jgi:diguanylate cyclase (GGDEF)-like protein